MNVILVSLGIILVFEGAIWALFPEQMKRAALMAAATPDNVLRITGLVAAISGVLLVWLIR